MDIVIVVVVPLLFLMLAASMLVVSQLSGFYHFNKYSKRQQENKREIATFMNRLAAAQNTVFQRSRQLEDLSSRLQMNNQELARLNSMKTKFLSMAVHDMRTPLATMKGFGEMLSRQVYEDKQKKYVDYIVRGSDKINDLLADLTDLSIIEAGKLRMSKSPFELSAMLDSDITPRIGFAAQEKGIVFTTTGLPQSVTVHGDRANLAKALKNMLNNAVKFTPAGGKVDLKVTLTGRGLLFQIKDTGPAIHLSERKRVFEKFYQSQFGDPKAKKQGWGLGLAIAHEIVKAHQGEAGVDSPGLGKGSTFWCRIPLKPSRAPMKALASLALFFLLGLLPGRAKAQSGIPLDDKAKFERSLEEKAESVLLRILGPNRSRVVVDATIDFTRIEKFEVKAGAAIGGEERNALFLWQNIGAQSGGQELLPGIPSPEAAPGFGAKSYERQNSFPSSFVKRLKVTVVLDRTVSAEMDDVLTRAVGEILNLQADRDEMSITRAPFAPPWKTIWHTQESVSLLFKYAVVSLMTLITLVVVAACFLKLASAMDSVAQAQAHQLQMDFGQGKEGEGGAGADGKKKEGEEEEEEEEGPQKIVFNVRPEQVETLAELLRGQDPENVALVAAHLSQDVKKLFFAQLSPSAYSQVLLHLSRIRFVEAEVVSAVKDELERRMDSAVGGRSNLLELIDTSDLRGKRELLGMLEATDPDLYAVARERILLFEDLSDLEEKDWSLVLSVVTLEEWAFALYEAPELLVEALRGQMLPKTWAILAQMMQVGRPSEAAVKKTHERIVKAVAKLIADGRITNPVTRRIELKTLQKEEALPAQEEGVLNG